MSTAFWIIAGLFLVIVGAAIAAMWLVLLKTQWHAGSGESERDWLRSPPTTSTAETDDWTTPYLAATTRPRRRKWRQAAAAAWRRLIP